MNRGSFGPSGMKARRGGIARNNGIEKSRTVQQQPGRMEGAIVIHTNRGDKRENVVHELAFQPFSLFVGEGVNTFQQDEALPGKFL